jgi:preprotein translocase subunit SecA
MLTNLREAVTGTLMHIESMPAEDEELTEVELPPMQAHHVDPFTGEDELAMADAVLAAEGRPGAMLAERRAPLQTRKSGMAVDPKNPATWGKVARNQPCPCGSGKKYKHCHGKHD